MPASPDPKRILVVGSGWRFTSGISYYTCRLANALSSRYDVGAILMRQWFPKSGIAAAAPHQAKVFQFASSSRSRPSYDAEGVEPSACSPYVFFFWSFESNHLSIYFERCDHSHRCYNFWKVFLLPRRINNLKSQCHFQFKTFVRGRT